MSQTELADRLTNMLGEKWSRDMVANLERGEKAFTVEILREVARIQALPYSFYLEGVGVDPGYVQALLDNRLDEWHRSNPLTRQTQQPTPVPVAV